MSLETEVITGVDKIPDLGETSQGRNGAGTSVCKTRERKKLYFECWAEFWGTLFIVVFGVGSVNTAVIVGAHNDLWHIAMIWGFGVGLAIYSTATMSGAHLNPAVTFALTIFKGFPVWKVGYYWFAQMAGGVVGGAMNFLIFHTYIARVEDRDGISRGGDSSENVAMVFGEYFPAPDWTKGQHDPDTAHHVISPFGAFCVEAWGTGILMFMILALTDDKQKVLVKKELAPFLIGFTVAVLIGVYAPLTQAGWNPARDFGPRLVACMAGWGKAAIPGPRNGFWVYILGPMVGAPLGAFAYITTLEPGLKMLAEEGLL